MEYGIGIAGFPDLLGLAAVVASIIVVGVMLQRLRGPNDRGLSR